MFRETDPTHRYPSTIRDLREANTNFEVDRPLVLAQKRGRTDFIQVGSKYVLSPDHALAEVELTASKKFLMDEIQELQEIPVNGAGAETGYFSEPENREDNRQQEISDVILFALAYYDGLGLDEAGLPYEPDEERIMEQMGEWLRDFEINEISYTQPPGKVERFNAHQEAIYDELVQDELQFQANILRRTPTSELSIKDKRRAIAALEQMLAISFTLFHLMGVNPIRQVYEKIVRNYLKHPAYLYGIEHVPQLDADLPAEQRRQLIDQAYRRQIKKAARLWNDPAHAGQVGYGTNDFFSQGRFEEEIPTASDGDHESIVPPVFTTISVE